MCSWLKDLQNSIEEPWESQGMERRQKDGLEQGTVVRGQREKILNGQMGDKRFGDESGVRLQH